MTQVSDYNVANDTGANIRSDLNAILAAVVTLNAGSSAPSTTYARMIWVDESTGLIKLRNAANSAWLTLALDPDVSKQLVGPVTVDGTLSANDVIESTSGGFKFPDATTQATAAVDKAIEVASTNLTATVTVTSSSFTQVLAASSYTLADAANVVLVIATLNVAVEGNANAALFRLQRDSTVILQGDAAGSRERVTGPMVNLYDESGAYDRVMHQVTLVYLDTPGSVGPFTYRVLARCLDGSKSLYLNRTVDDDDDADHPRAASSITLIEFAP